MSKTAVILGGGISGLSAAFYLSKLPGCKFGKIILLESSSRLGGWVKTTRFEDGAIFEHGPRSIRPVGIRGANTLELVDELGLTDQVIPCLSSSSASKNRFLYINRKMCTLPSGIKSLFTTQAPFSKPLFVYGLKEMFTKKGHLDDESVHSFMSRRFGNELADYAIDPVCRGIFAGDCRELSMAACFPDVFKMEQQYGSLVKGLFRSPKDSKSTSSSALVRKAKDERWATWQLKNGLQQLTEALSEAAKQDGRLELRTNSPCTALEVKADGKIKVKTSDEVIEADHVISSMYAKDLSKLLDGQPALSKPLSNTPAASVVIVNLEFEGHVMPHEGFGHLLPSSESGPVLGIVYDSCAFPQHNRKDHAHSTRLTVMLGGSWFAELVKENPQLDESMFLKKSLDILKNHLDIASTASKTNVSILENCIPQYTLGHSSRLSSMLDYITDNSIPLSLVGASYRGPAVNDCIYHARQAVHNLP